MNRLETFENHLVSVKHKNNISQADIMSQKFYKFVVARNYMYWMKRLTL